MYANYGYPAYARTVSTMLALSVWRSVPPRPLSIRYACYCGIGLRIPMSSFLSSLQLTALL